MSATKWCCAGLEGHFRMTGMRGFSVFVAAAGANSAFILQHRAVEPGAATPNSDQPLSVVSDVQIQFCPWCGVRLQKHYQERLQDLDRSDLRISL